jgi:hypothetical protein
MGDGVDDMLLAMAQKLLREKKVKDFRSLFEYIPYDIIARAMEISDSRFLDLIMKPKNFKMGQVYRLAEILNYNPVKMAKMVTAVVDEEWGDSLPAH